MKGGPGVALIRVDNRLVHGQVLEAWLPALDAHGVLIADDEAAGNVHFVSGRRQVAPSLYLDAGEMEALTRLASRGTEVEARAVPSEHATPLSVLRSRFSAACT